MKSAQGERDTSSTNNRPPLWLLGTSGFLPGVFPKKKIFVYKLQMSIKETSDVRKEMQHKLESLQPQHAITPLAAFAVWCLRAAHCPSPGARRQRCLLPRRKFSLVLPCGTATRRLQLQTSCHISSVHRGLCAAVQCCKDLSLSSVPWRRAKQSLHQSLDNGAEASPGGKKKIKINFKKVD